MFSPIPKMNCFFLIITLSAWHAWEVHHIDVKSDFLHANLEEIYMDNALDIIKVTPTLFSTLVIISMVLNKVLEVGMQKLMAFLDTEFSRCHFDPNAYTKKVGSHIIITFFLICSWPYSFGCVISYWIFLSQMGYPFYLNMVYDQN